MTETKTELNGKATKKLTFTNEVDSKFFENSVQCKQSHKMILSVARGGWIWSDT